MIPDTIKNFVLFFIQKAHHGFSSFRQTYKFPCMADHANPMMGSLCVIRLLAMLLFLEV